MVKFNTYNPKVEVLRATEDPAVIVTMAARQTQVIDAELKATSNAELIKFLYNADHGSVLEHAVITMRISGISRAALAQITRHRMASYTSSSQHYADHRDAEFISGMRTVSLGGMYTSAFSAHSVERLVDETFDLYAELVDSGVSLEEARMILPQGCQVCLIMTINARSLANLLTQRLCERNVFEMKNLARQIHNVAAKWFPELFSIVGPDCEQKHFKCTQGKMSCRAQR